MGLTPTLYSPLAQWALRDIKSGPIQDRSGNSRHFAGAQGGMRYAPDLYRGYYCYGGMLSGGVYASTLTNAVFRLSGAFTISARIFLRGDGVAGYFLACGLNNSEIEAGNVQYALGVDASGNMRYFAEYGAGTDILHTSTLALTSGFWYFLVYRRNAAGTLVTYSRGDFDGFAHQASTALTAPTGGGSTILYLGSQGISSGSGGWQNAMADISIWNSELTNDQIETLRYEAMAPEGGYVAPPDTTAPIVTFLSPAPGSTLSKRQTVSLRVTEESSLRACWLLVEYPSGLYEVIWDGSKFSRAYQGSQRVAVAGGHDYVLTRQEGWPGSPTFRAQAVDAGGNLAA